MRPKNKGSTLMTLIRKKANLLKRASSPTSHEIGKGKT